MGEAKRSLIFFYSINYPRSTHISHGYDTCNFSFSFLEKTLECLLIPQHRAHTWCCLKAFHIQHLNPQNNQEISLIPPRVRLLSPRAALAWTQNHQNPGNHWGVGLATLSPAPSVGISENIRNPQGGGTEGSALPGTGAKHPKPFSQLPCLLLQYKQGIQGVYF